jgi:transposase
MIMNIGNQIQYAPWLKALAAADEDQARRFAAARALALSWDGISTVERLTSMTHTTIRKGIAELQSEEKLGPPKRLRGPGGGQKRVEIKDLKLIGDLEKIMDEDTAGDPMSFLKWTNKSTYRIAEELNLQGHRIDLDTVRRLLKEMDYSLQANMKTREAGSGPERDAQFRYINEELKSLIRGCGATSNKIAFIASEMELFSIAKRCIHTRRKLKFR